MFLDAYHKNVKYLGMDPVDAVEVPAFMTKGVHVQEAIVAVDFWPNLSEDTLIRHCFDVESVGEAMQDIIVKKIDDVTSKGSENHEKMFRVFSKELPTTLPKLSRDGVDQLNDVRRVVQFKGGDSSNDLNHSFNRSITRRRRSRTHWLHSRMEGL